MHVALHDDVCSIEINFGKKRKKIQIISNKTNGINTDMLWKNNGWKFARLPQFVQNNQMKIFFQNIFIIHIDI